LGCNTTKGGAASSRLLDMPLNSSRPLRATPNYALQRAGIHKVPAAGDRALPLLQHPGVRGSQRNIKRPSLGQEGAGARVRASTFWAGALRLFASHSVGGRMRSLV